jgi:hypothetical protein
MFHQASNTGKSIPISELARDKMPHTESFHAPLTEAEKAKMNSYPKSDFFGDTVKHTHAEVEIEVDNSPDPVQPEYDRDHQNDGGHNEKTGFKNPPGREKNYLRMRSRIGRRR